MTERQYACRRTSTAGLQSSTVTTPSNTTTIRVSTTMHHRIRTMASARNQTVDQVLSDLLSPTTVVMRLTSHQYRRWATAAGERGMAVGSFVAFQVECGLGGMFTSLIERTFYTVRALAEHHGVRPSVGRQTSTDELQTSTDDDLPSSTEGLFGTTDGLQL